LALELRPTGGAAPGYDQRVAHSLGPTLNLPLLCAAWIAVVRVAVAGRKGGIMRGNGQWRKSYPEELAEKGRDLLTGDKSAVSSGSAGSLAYEPLWTPEQVAQRFNVSPDWVRDHSSRKEPDCP
jgi:hypothetical protein